MFDKIKESENQLSLEILKNQKLSEQGSTPIYSGVAVILPNITEVPNENIKFVIEETN